MNKSKTLIQVIKNAIEMNAGGDALLHERSFLSHLLEKKEGDPIFQNDSIRAKKYDDLTYTENQNNSIQTKKHEESNKTEKNDKRKNFVVTREVFHIIAEGIRWIIWAIHVIGYLLFDRDRLKGVKIFNIKSSPIINLLAIVITLVLGILVIVNTATVAIKEIMFPQTYLRANDKGVISINQPFMETHSFFLQNASTFWESTGITLNKGDKVFFSVSGSMYSDVGELYNASVNNDTLRYHRSEFDIKDRILDTAGLDYCIYNSSNRCFGTLLCQVVPEHQLPILSQRYLNQGDTIYQITKNNNTFKPGKPGILYITFNDILLTREIVTNLLLDTAPANKEIREDLINSDFFLYDKKNSITEEGIVKDSSYKKDLIRLNNTAAIVKKELVDKFYNDCYNNDYFPDSTVWFKDNLGEYLVNIRVERNIWKSDLNFIKKCFFSILREFNHCLLRIGYCKTFFWILVFILLYIFIDIVVSCMVSRRNKKNGSVNKESHGNEQPGTKDKHQKMTSSPQRKTKAAGKKRQKPKEAGGK